MKLCHSLPRKRWRAKGKIQIFSRRRDGWPRRARIPLEWRSFRRTALPCSDVRAVCALGRQPLGRRRLGRRRGRVGRAGAWQGWDAALQHSAGPYRLSFSAPPLTFTLSFSSCCSLTEPSVMTEGVLRSMASSGTSTAAKSHVKFFHLYFSYILAQKDKYRACLLEFFLARYN